MNRIIYHHWAAILTSLICSIISNNTQVQFINIQTYTDLTILGLKKNNEMNLNLNIKQDTHQHWLQETKLDNGQ